MQLGLFAGLLACMSLTTPAFAAEQTSSTATPTESILLSPASKKYELNAGDTKTDSLRVVNDGAVAFDFAVYARPYYVDESYQADFTSKAQNADAYRWVSFEKTSFHLEPNEHVEVQYSVRVPSNATPGGHYGVIFVETQPGPDSASGSVVRKKRLGSIMYATVDGNITTSGKSLGVDVPFFQFSAPLRISERVRNSGNTHFDVQTNVKVTDIFGGVKYIVKSDSTILPDRTKRVVSDWADPSWIGLYKVTHTSSFLDTKHTSSHYVLLVPIWVYLTVGLLIGARTLYAVASRKKRR